MRNLKTLRGSTGLHCHAQPRKNIGERVGEALKLNHKEDATTHYLNFSVLRKEKCPKKRLRLFFYSDFWTPPNWKYLLLPVIIFRTMNPYASEEEKETKPNMGVSPIKSGHTLFNGQAKERFPKGAKSRF